MAADEGTFLSRWSRRKASAQAALAPALEPLPAEPALVMAPAVAAVLPLSQAEPETEAEPPGPTMADVAQLTPASDYTRYLGSRVAPEVKNAALKKLFSDPHFNVMDGLDTYIGDYNTPDPLPPGMLRQMVQSQMLGLFADEDKPPEPEAAAHEDPDLQLQPDDGAGRPGADTGPGPHPERPD